jgi:hypothetical protein
VTQARVLISLIFIFVLSLFSCQRAQAESELANSAVNVALTTVAGAVLGASTLPFYDEPGEHTKNIFYGAAIGAVVGVIISAYAGVKEGPDYEDARLSPRKPSALPINEAPSLRLHAEASSALRKHTSFAEGTTLAWSPLTSIHF